MRTYKYQAYVIGRRGIELKIVWAHSESEAMDQVFEKMPEDSILKSIERIN